MIPSAFDYVRPDSLSDALALLARHRDAAKPMSGGHSLLPMMKLRLAAPDLVVDVNELGELHGITVGRNEVVVGAATTHATLEHHPEVAAALPLMPVVACQIADATVRNRGTLGGSLAHADPSADWPAAMLAQNAVFEVAGSSGSRSIAARDFFKGLFETALQPGELIVAVRIPVAANTRVAYRKFRHPASGYAVVGVAVVLDYDKGRCGGGCIAITGFADHAFRAERAEAELSKHVGEPSHIERLLDLAFDGVAPIEDRFADAEYRLQLARTMLRRALADAQSSFNPARSAA
ncbi:xanthine dehydrogenase family protein subunit M [Piscinibacter sp. XHJ-5]|uniref:FAD binding domain-containing protein n=1 Tax=Piscinibacter sp. XHJ-5 TaxID=3037797 RepID=UPI0024535C67|nr:xanthine dehydrogenase family protein subunit M [Piscinibacter sp. XHJ-5]